MVECSSTTDPFNMIFVIGLLAVIVTSPPSTRAENAYIQSRPNNKKGSISSPAYTLSDTSDEEKTFKFTGDYNELVQIEFDDFDLPNSEPSVCGMRNAFLSYWKEDRTPIYLCGPQRPLPILSEKRIFVLEYKVPRYLDSSIPYRGFNASYRFVTNFGIDSGIQDQDMGCDFLYSSEYDNNGTITSPNYPGNYPKSIRCIYEFRGTEKYLKLNFTEFNLLGSIVCSLSGDTLELTQTVDRDRNYFYEQRCGQLNSFNITVNASNFFIIFTSSSKNNIIDSNPNNPPRFIGFRAYYEFTNDTTTGSGTLCLLESSFHLFFTSTCLLMSYILNLHAL